MKKAELWLAIQSKFENVSKTQKQNLTITNYSYEGKIYPIKLGKKLTVLLLLFFLVSFQMFSQSNVQSELGTPESVLNEILNQRSRSSSTLALQLNTRETAVINIADYFYKNDNVSIHGTAKESANSSFILKGNRASLYGYLVLHDKKIAYEITTLNGRVFIDVVNISKIYPDRYETMIKPPAQNAPLAAVLPVYSPMAKRQVIHIGPYNNEDVTKLQSKPGSPYVFYLNTSAVMNGDTPKNGKTKEAMYRVWQCVADQYSMFNLNVTTDLSVYTAAKNKDVLKTGIIDFIDEDGISHACVSCFGTTESGTLYRGSASNDYGYELGRTCSHEMGHQMGILHDGGSAQPDPEYFFGLPAVEWCPIMGNYYYGDYWSNQLYTWSKGEYNTATNTEDDLAIMNVNESIPYMTDDIPSVKAMKLGNGGIVSSTNNWGQIERNTDTDGFTFSIASGGGKVNLRIDPLEYLRQLDVAAKIVDSKGTVISSSNLSKNRSAEFKDVSLSEGSYSLIIQGGAELTPQTGFSNYSSLGYYGIEGTIAGAIITSIEEITLSNSIVAFPNPTEDILNISFSNRYSNAKITLVSLTGQTVFTSDKFVPSIDMSNLAKGIYLLKITVEGESCVKKISKL